MTVKELIEKLKEFPEDLPVAVDFDIGRLKDDTIESTVELSIRTWEHDNFPYDREPFEYLNIE